MNYTTRQQKPETNKAITRSGDKLVAGVCGGVAEALGWDTARVRIVWLLLSIITGALPGLLVYSALWFVMPEPQAAAHMYASGLKPELKKHVRATMEVA